jgi:hypothetical protein
MLFDASELEVAEAKLKMGAPINDEFSHFDRSHL